jgi:hypothetical protein
MTILQPVNDGRGKLVGRFPQGPGQDESDVTGQIAELLVARGFYLKGDLSPAPDRAPDDRVAQRLTNERVNVPLHAESRAKDTTRRARPRL